MIPLAGIWRNETALVWLGDALTLVDYNFMTNPNTYISWDGHWYRIPVEIMGSFISNTVYSVLPRRRYHLNIMASDINRSMGMFVWVQIVVDRIKVF